MALGLLCMAGMNRRADRRFTVRRLIPAALAASLLTGSACVPKPTVVSIWGAAIGGMIGGVVTGPADTTLADRTVTMVNVETGERYQTATGQKGGYSLRVPGGRYRLEVQLRPGERLAENEPPILINTADGEIHKDVTVNPQQQ